MSSRGYGHGGIERSVVDNNIVLLNNDIAAITLSDHNSSPIAPDFTF